jgi:uncharacterized protein with GYD domain
MTQFSYSDRTWAKLINKPQDRSEYLRTTFTQLGGRLIDFYYSLGEYDGVVIFETPDETTGTAILIAVNAADYLRAIKTTKLLTIAETLQAMHKAGAIGVQGPDNA